MPRSKDPIRLILGCGPQAAQAWIEALDPAPSMINSRVFISEAVS